MALAARVLAALAGLGCPHAAFAHAAFAQAALLHADFPPRASMHGGPPHAGPVHARSAQAAPAQAPSAQARSESAGGAGAAPAQGGRVAASPADAARACAPPRQVAERFIAADCLDCWTAPRESAPAPAEWTLDWIVPAAAGPDAPLAAAALPEGAARLADLEHAASALPARLDWSLPRRPTLRLAVQAGPAWNGYLGLQLRSRGPAPDGARAYLALVEELPAGSEGSPIARRLVRAVVGPITLARDAPSLELRALRVPETAHPERLRGVAWWVDARQRLRGVAREGCGAG